MKALDSPFGVNPIDFNVNTVVIYCYERLLISKLRMIYSYFVSGIPLLGQILLLIHILHNKIYK
jgi:hypothetical protein